MDSIKSPAIQSPYSIMNNQTAERKQENFTHFFKLYYQYIWVI